MRTESKIFDFINKILSKIQEKCEFLTKKSFILANIEQLMFVFICLACVCSLFLGNSATAPILCAVGVLYVLTMFLKNGAKLTLNKSSLFLILYLVTAIISTINSTMPHASLTGFSKTVLYMLFFVAVYQYLKLHREKVFLLGGLIGICVSFEIAVAFMQNYLDVMSAATWQDTSRLNPELVLTRVYGTLKPSNPNLLGGYFVVAVPFLWMTTAINYIEKKNKRFIINFIFSVLSVPAIFMTGCRGAYLALFAMLLVVALATYDIWKHHYPKIYSWVNAKKNMILGIGAAAIAGVMICVPKISHRILSIFAMRNDSSTSFRMNVYHSSWQMFQDNVLMGIGCGNKVFREIYGLYMLSGFDALSAYSVFLEIAVESGIFALIFFVLFLWFLVYYAYKAFKMTTKIREKIILASGFASVSGVLIHGFVDTVYFRPQVQLMFWIVVAVLYVYSFDNTKLFASENEK